MNGHRDRTTALPPAEGTARGQPHAQERRTSTRRPASSPPVLVAAGRHGKEDMEWDREQITQKTSGRFLCPERRGAGRAFGGHRRYTGNQNSRGKGGRGQGAGPADAFKSHLQCCGDYHRPERPRSCAGLVPRKGACQSWKKHGGHVAQHKGPRRPWGPVFTPLALQWPQVGRSVGAEEPKTSGSDEKGPPRLYGIQVLLCPQDTRDHRAEETHLTSSTSPDPHTRQALDRAV